MKIRKPDFPSEVGLFYVNKPPTQRAMLVIVAWSVMRRHTMAYDATSNLTLCIRRILLACFLAASIPLSILNTNSIYYVSYTSHRPGIGRTSVVILKEKCNSSNIFCGLQTTCFQYS